tara:strand:+ start:36092 stop:37456 length:1365 start_codon:yes stop_codon:yes gene_type:complete
MNTELRSLSSKKKLQNIHIITLLTVFFFQLIFTFIFDQSLYFWQLTTLYTGIYSSIVPFNYFFSRPHSIILFIIFLSTIRNSCILFLNTNFALSNQFSELSFLIFFSVIVISILDAFSGNVDIKFGYLQKSKSYIFISITLICILPIFSILVPNGKEQFFLLSNFLLFSNIAIPSAKKTIFRMIINCSIYIIFYLITLFIFYTLNYDFALNRTTFLIPFYLSIVVLMRNLIFTTKLYNISLLNTLLSILNFLKSKKVLLYMTILVSTLTVGFLYALVNKILSSGLYYGELGDILAFVIRFQINEFINPDIIRTFSERLSEITNSTISQQLTFKSFYWIFSFIIPSFLFPNRPILNVSEYLKENVGFWYENYFEPFFHFFVEGSSILFVFYIVFLPLILLYLCLKLTRENSFSGLVYYLYFSIYSYFSYSFGFTRYILAPFFGSLILFLTKRMRI